MATNENKKVVDITTDVGLDFGGFLLPPASSSSSPPPPPSGKMNNGISKASRDDLSDTPSDESSTPTALLSLSSFSTSDADSALFQPLSRYDSLESVVPIKQNTAQTKKEEQPQEQVHPALIGNLTPPNPSIRANFSPGPTGLPREVMAQVAQSLLNSVTGEGGGMLSAMFLSHRSPEFADPNTGILAKAVQGVREVMNIPNGSGNQGYEILFLHGGGHGQFASVPLNLCGSPSDKATYIVSGTWSQRAIGEASKYCQPDIISSKTSEGKFHTFPTIDFQDPTQVDPTSKFVYLCTNETVNGIEVFDLPTGEDRSPVPLVLDASSDFTSKPIDWLGANVGVLFACASKNIGHPGVTAVIIRRDLLQDRIAQECCPSVFNYKIQAEAGNLWNTAATFNIQVVGMMMDWILRNGGLDEMERLSKAKADLIYDVVDESNGFYSVPPVSVENRSRMNVPFSVIGIDADSESLTERFLIEAWEQGIVGLRTITPFGVGEYLRASLYHGVSLEDTHRLVDFMKRFMKENRRLRR